MALQFLRFSQDKGVLMCILQKHKKIFKKHNSKTTTSLGRLINVL